MMYKSLYWNVRILYSVDEGCNSYFVVTYNAATMPATARRMAAAAEVPWEAPRAPPVFVDPGAVAVGLVPLPCGVVEVVFSQVWSGTLVRFAERVRSAHCT